MDAHALLSDFRSRGIALIPNGEKLTVEPASRLTDADRAAIRAAKAELLKLLAAAGLHDREEDEIDRVASGDGWRPPPEPRQPAYGILETCQRYGVALRIDRATGDLVVGRAGANAEEPTQPWTSLLHALETHLEAVARLVKSGWTLTAEFPREAAA
jgi:hypothetical protein